MTSSASAREGLLHDGATPLAPTAAATLVENQAEALAELPVETLAGTCASTSPVDGLGDACRTRGGLFRVELDSGATISTHGGDAPRDPNARVASAPHLPASQAAIDGASVDDIECVTAPSDRRIELVYAYPSNRPNRIASVEGPMRQAIYEASAFIDAESRAMAPAAGRRLRVLCSGGVPIVQVIQVPAVGSGGTSFAEAVDNLVAAGFPEPVGLSTSPRRALAYYDSRSSSGAAGTGDLWTDDRPGSLNYNNRGARYAIEWDWSSSRLPHWDVLLHEAAHNMGAIADGAPDASGNGHCNDGLDVMCYGDGGVTSSYTETSCSTERFDCGGDSYFNPSPGVGSWLADHWNVASTANSWIQPWDAGWDEGGTPDAAPPSMPAGVTASSVTVASITASWNASTDDRSVVGYRMFVDRDVSGAWVLDSTIGPTSASSATVSDLASATRYRIRVVAIDQAGNTSVESIPLVTSTTAPTLESPATVDVALADATSIEATWPAAPSTAAIAGYEVGLQRGAGTWSSLGQTSQTRTRISGLERGESWHVRIRTVTTAGATSTWRTSAGVATPAVTLATVGETAATPERPLVAGQARSATSAVVSWDTSLGAATWSAQVIDPAGAIVATFPRATVRTVLVTGLRPNVAYTARVVGYATAGSTVSAPGAAAFTTPRDTLAPSIVRLLGTPRVKAATVRVAWRAATDNVGVVRYEVQRKVGKRWVGAARTTAAARAATVKGLKARSVTLLRIRAVDGAGVAGRWTTFAVRRR